MAQNEDNAPTSRCIALAARKAPTAPAAGRPPGYASSATRGSLRSTPVAGGAWCTGSHAPPLASLLRIAGVSATGGTGRAGAKSANKEVSWSSRSNTAPLEGTCPKPPVWRRRSRTTTRTSSVASASSPVRAASSRSDSLAGTSTRRRRRASSPMKIALSRRLASGYRSKPNGPHGGPGVDVAARHLLPETVYIRSRPLRWLAVTEHQRIGEG